LRFFSIGCSINFLHFFFLWFRFKSDKKQFIEFLTVNLIFIVYESYNVKDLFWEWFINANEWDFKFWNFLTII
jgi:hypothetical protein